MAQQQQTTIPSTPVITNASRILLINGDGGQSPVRRCMFPGCTRPYSEHLWHVRIQSDSPAHRNFDTPRSTGRTYRQLSPGQQERIIYDGPIVLPANDGIGQQPQEQPPQYPLNEQDVPEEYADAAANMDPGSDQLLPLWDEVESELNAKKWRPNDGLNVQDRCFLCLGEREVHWRFNQCGCTCICTECAGDWENMEALRELAEERSAERLKQWKRKWDWHSPCWWTECNCQKELDSVLDVRPLCLNCNTAKADKFVRALRSRSPRQRKQPLRYSPMMK